MFQGGPKHAILSSLAEIAQAIGHEYRLGLLECLAQGKRSVEELAQLNGLTFANASRHLQILRRASLVTTERQGKYVLYSLNGQNEVTSLLRALGCVGERNRAEVKQVMNDYFFNRGTLIPVSQAELLQQLSEGSVTLLDVRSEQEFAGGHLPGAINIPLAELEQKLSELPKGQEIVAYCRGPYCVLAVEAVNFLRSKGYQVRRFEEGFPEWRAAGLEVEAVI